MASFNKVILMGNLCADPEMRVTPSGMSICKFTIAVNRKFTTKEGEEREEVAFVDVDAFGRSAEVISKYLTKGSPILVEGRIKQDRWETKEGENRSKLMVVCESFKFVGGQSQDGENQRQSIGDYQPQRHESSNATDNEPDDSEPPF